MALSFIAGLGVRARRGFGRVTPEPFAIAVALTVLVLVATLAWGELPPPKVVARSPLDPEPSLLEALALWLRASILASPLRVLSLWHASGGLWKLLAFAMQASLMLVLGTALASAPPVRRALLRLIDRAWSPRALVGLTALVSIALAVLNWSLGLIGGALLARAAGLEAARRGWRLHYPLLCAAGYSGLMVWHGGLSGSAPLKATNERDMVEVLGAELAARVGTIPLDESLFGALNLWVTGGLLVLGPLLFMALTPGDGEDPEPTAPPDVLAAEAAAERAEDLPPADASWLDAVERSPVVTVALALPLGGALLYYLADQGIGRVDLNTVLLALWVLALALHGRPHRFIAACDRGIRSCTGIFLLFPLYAGIMGLLSGSGLMARLAGGFADASAGLFTTLAFLSAGLLNLLVPSGGGQWAIQGPILLTAGLERGIEPAHAMMAMAYGDQWSNMLQPFWAVPLLAVTRVRARDIVGYCALWMLVGGLWIVGALLLLT
ncbi:MAG: short-chain fatty acid transporter [Myxococcales bacterium]|nr:short-chain fatty acid transporter [Myxococcales bacterium]